MNGHKHRDKLLEMLQHEQQKIGFIDLFVSALSHDERFDLFVKEHESVTKDLWENGEFKYDVRVTRDMMADLERRVPYRSAHPMLIVRDYSLASWSSLRDAVEQRDALICVIEQLMREQKRQIAVYRAAFEQILENSRVEMPDIEDTDGWIQIIRSSETHPAAQPQAYTALR